MKNMKTCLIACAVVASINSFAAIVVSGPGDSIIVSEDGVNANGYLGTTDLAGTGTASFTMTGGSLSATNVNDGNVIGIYSDNGSGADVTISGGTLIVTESGVGDATGIRMNDNSAGILTISGGTFNLTESGDGDIYAIRQIRDEDINISGGIWNFSQDGTGGGIFVTGGGADGVINLSGGLFNNLDQFDNHIVLAAASQTMNIDVLSLTDTGLTYDGDTITDSSGTITGVLADGNGFSFNFSNGASSMITTTVIPEPATLGLIAALGGSMLFIRRFIQM